MKIVVRNAKKSFGENVVFTNINIEFNTGNFYLIKGANGSGKTVFLKSLCGYIKLTEGKIMQDGIEIRENNNYILDAGITIESPQFLAHLTLKENLDLLKRMTNKITDEKINYWINFYKLENFVNTKYKNLSLGTKQKLAIIQAFIHNPKVLILDEPFNALDKDSMRKTEDYLQNIKKDSIIIVSTHINDGIKYMSDYEYIFVDGKLVLDL